MEINLVEIWLRKDPKRWVAGIFAGIFAGLVLLLVAIVLGKINGFEVWTPIKMAAIPILGSEAMQEGLRFGSLAVGFGVHSFLCGFLGFVYAHFTGTNNLKALFGVGLTWGAFGWIFINNLFSQSFREIYVVAFPRSISFFAWMAFGVALVSVAFFDRILRGSPSTRS